jgi:hypothetical protein
VAEQLALEQVRRHRAAVDDQERLVAPRLPLWIASAETSLPVPVSPSSRIVASLSTPSQHVENRLHRGRAPDHPTEAAHR